MPYEGYTLKTEEDGSEVYIAKRGRTTEHTHEWYREGKYVKCKGCTLFFLDLDKNFPIKDETREPKSGDTRTDKR